MYVSYDLAVGATYVQMDDAPVHATRSVSDLVMVDVTESGDVIGVEFAVAPADITEDMLHALADAFPSLKELVDTKIWLLTHA